MLGSIPHQNSVFIIHLLEDEQELSLGMLDTSPMYLYFLIIPCYYIICFGCLMGFIMLFYIIFGTNLLTGGPVPVSIFLPISVFQGKGISNGIQTEWNLCDDLFWNKRNLGDLKWRSRKPRGGHEVGGCAQGGRHVPHSRGPLVAPPTYFFRLYILLYPKTFGEGDTSPTYL